MKPSPDLVDAPIVEAGQPAASPPAAAAPVSESESPFRALFEAAGDAMLIADDARVYLDANPAACRLLGAPREAIIGRRIEEFAVPEVVAMIEEAWPIFLAQGRRQAEFQILRADGVRRDVEFSGTANFVPGRHLSVLRDITERKLAAEALRRSEERFARAFQASPDSITISHLHSGRILDINDGCMRLTGYSREEVIGQNVATIQLWADPAQRDQLIRRLHEHGQVRDFEATIRLRSGLLGHVSLAAEIIEIEGEPCLLIIGRDINERKQMEDRMRAAERLGALGRVASGVAHEFNNILAAVMGRLDLLTLELAGTPAAASLHIVQQAVEDGATVVQRLQAFARLREPGARVALPVNELVAQVIAFTEPRWRAAPGAPLITLRTQVEQGLAVLGDPTELREVLINLIFNAVDALPRGGRIFIEAGARGDQVAITIRDTGVGMDALTQERIFEPFFTTKISGTGLGLTVVRDILHSHGGTISVVSNMGGGTTFTLTLPAATAPAAEAPAPPAAPAPPRAARILAVDDDARLGDMLRAMLALNGHEVVVAGSGAEALRLLDDSFDLVCTDLAMPGMNGWEVARQVRDRRPDLAIILITGWEVPLDSAELAAQTVDFVLHKPYRVAQVQEVVAQALARRTQEVHHA